ncbi:MAG: carbohydrate-binding family 9-like protein [Myxococcota bacterium]
MRLFVLAMGVMVLAACRDEQAGPKHRPPSLPPASGNEVRAFDAVPTDLTYRSGATWAQGAVVYHGSRVQPPNPRPGQAVMLTHYFSATRAPPVGFRFFVHLVDESGQMVVNMDHEIQNGAAPLARWPVGKVIEDQHSFPLPAQPGRFRLLLGFWQDDARLPVDNPSTHDGSGRVLGPVLSSGEPALPEYRVWRAQKAPVIDGVLDDPAWQKATAVELVGSFDGRKPMLRTTARLTYDDRHLYVAFDSEDPDAWGTFRNPDDPLYTEEVVEVFLDANGDGRTYNELQVSPNNVTFDAMFVARRSDLAEAMRWKSGMKTAVKVRGTVNDPNDRDEGWSAEMQIPVAALAEVPNVPPKPGDRWRFNLYRLEHLGRRQVEGQAFSPLFAGDFHHLPRFGWLSFE